VKSPDWSDGELAVRRAGIKTPEVFRAFDLLVAYGVSSPDWETGPSGHGWMKNVQFKASGESPFAFTSTRQHLLLYVRSAGVRILRTTAAELSKSFNEVKEGSKGELTVKIRTEADARRVISQLLEKWIGARKAVIVDHNVLSEPRVGWSRTEVEATVADYFAMLLLDLAGRKYNKAEHNRALQRLLSNRSQAAVELKHQNISAILIELGCVYIPGYKPRGNYQSLLREVVEARLRIDREFELAASLAVERDANVAPVIDFRNVLVEAPRPSGIREDKNPLPYVRRAIRCDYLEREARNRKLGIAGEEFIAEFESRRLHASGHLSLSNRVEHVSKTQGDGLGYDVLSFESSGEERLIEVKTTSFGPLTPFYLSRNELSFSEEKDTNFVLARVHEFRTSPKFFELKGSLKKCLQVEPVNYRAFL
jgi:hypothetical protein